MSDTVLHINALLTETGVNMGDHAQDVTVAVILDPGMTVRELCERHLMRETWVSFDQPSRTDVNADKSLTIRLAATQ